MNASPFSARIAPLEPPYNAETEAMLMKWMPPGAAMEPLSLFRLLARSPELMSRMRPLGAGILGNTSSLDRHEREILIDRTCAQCGCEYEWGVHAAAFGAAFGLSEEQIGKTVTGAGSDAVWSERESLLIQLADELHQQSSVSDDLWARLEQEWKPEQIIEMIVLIGWYHLISFVANAARLPAENWAVRFPRS